MTELIKKYLINCEQFIPTLDDFLRKYPIILKDDFNDDYYQVYDFDGKKTKCCFASECLFKRHEIYNPHYITSINKYEIDGKTFYLASSFEIPDELDPHYYLVYSFFKIENGYVKSVFRQLDSKEMFEYIPNDLRKYYLRMEASTPRGTIFNLDETEHYEIGSNILKIIGKTSHQLDESFVDEEYTVNDINITIEEFKTFSYADKIKCMIKILWREQDIPQELFNIVNY